VFYQFTLGGGIPQGLDFGTGAPRWVVVLASFQVGLATAIRWILIPRVARRTLLRVLMLFGVGLSDAVVFYGIFFVPQVMPRTKLAFFLASFLSALQFAPIYFAPREESGFRQNERN
jgi:hypothetical protein